MGDVNCLGPVDDKTNKCKAGGLNPFFAADLYHQLETEKYWTEVSKESGNDQPSHYEPKAWARYQCAQLTKYHDVKEDCTVDPQAVAGKYLSKENFEKQKMTDETKKMLASNDDGHYFLPSLTPKGTET